MTTGKKTAFFTLLVAGAIIVLSFYVSSRAEAQSGQKVEEEFFAQFRHYTAFSPYEEMPVLHLVNEEGESFLFSAKQDKILLVSFWASWCAPCIEEIPTLMTLRENFDKDIFEIIFVSLDFPHSSKGRKKVVEKVNVPSFSTFYTQDSKIWETFAADGVPTTLLISLNGGIMYKMFGDTDWTSPQSLDFIKSIIDTVE